MNTIFEQLKYSGNIKPYNKRIPKSQLFLHGGLTKAERDLLTERVEEVRLSFVFNSHTYPMESVVTSEACYDAIFVMLVTLRKEVSIPKLSKIIQESVPSPTLILFQLNGAYLFSTALKRLHKNERGKVVVEGYHTGAWINLSQMGEADKEFLASISYGTLPALDYQQAYSAMHQQVYQQANAAVVATVKAGSFEELKQKAEEQKVVLQEIARLTKVLNGKTTSLKERVEIAKQIKELKKKE